MNTTLIRIKTETKKELDRLMLSKMFEQRITTLHYPDFLEELVKAYKENK